MTGEPLVKICGIRCDAEVIRTITALPVDFVGFVFAPSRRRVAPEEAVAAIRALHDAAEGSGRKNPPQAVGVFARMTWDEMESVLRRVPLDAVQLHGGEPPEMYLRVRDAFPAVRIIRAVSLPASGKAVDGGRRASDGEDGGAVSPDGPIDEHLAPYAGAIDILLLDTFDPVYGGGSGRTFDWSAVDAYRDAARRFGWPLFVAGGLTPDNVGELIARHAPDGVDVSGGVETDGRKDPAKIAAFVERVKRHG